MSQTIKQENASDQNHQEAMALLEEMAGCLRLPRDVIHDLAEKVTEKPCAELDMAAAEEVVKVLSDLVGRSLSHQPAHTPMWHRGQRLTRVKDKYVIKGGKKK